MNSTLIKVLFSLFFVGAVNHLLPMSLEDTINCRIDFALQQSRIWSADTGKVQFETLHNLHDEFIPYILTNAVLNDLWGMSLGKGCGFNLKYSERLSFVEMQLEYWNALKSNNKEKAWEVLTTFEKLSNEAQNTENTKERFAIEFCRIPADLKKAVYEDALNVLDGVK